MSYHYRERFSILESCGQFVARPYPIYRDQDYVEFWGATPQEVAAELLRAFPGCKADKASIDLLLPLD